MKFQEYRIIEFDGEIKPGVDIPMVFEFLAFGSKGILKPPYELIIHINEFIGEVVYSKCNCIDCDIRRNENCKRFAGLDYKCKHIKGAEEILIRDKHLTNTKKPKVVILDDNELSMACYAEEYPENFKEITDTKQKERSNEIPEIETREIFKENPNMTEPVLTDSKGNYLPPNDRFNSSAVQSTHSEDSK